MAKGERFKRLALQRSKQQGISYSKARKQLRQKAMVSPQETLMSNLDRNTQIIAVRAWLSSAMYGTPGEDRTFGEPSKQLMDLLGFVPAEFWAIVAECPELEEVRFYNAGGFRDLETGQNIENLKTLLKSSYLKGLRSLCIQLADPPQEGITQLLGLPSLASLERLTLRDPGTLENNPPDREERSNKARYTVTPKTLTEIAFAQLSGLQGLDLGEGYTLAPELISRLKELCPKLASLKVSAGGRTGAPTETSGDQFIEALAKETLSLNCLSHPNSHLTAKGVQHLIDAKGISNLQGLHLHYNPLGDEGARLLASKAHLFKNLKTLLLEGCEIGDAGATALASALFPSLENLELGLNDIGGVGARAMVRGSLIGQLTGLGLKENPIPPKEVKNLQLVWAASLVTLGHVARTIKGSVRGLKVGPRTGSLEDLPRG